MAQNQTLVHLSRGEISPDNNAEQLRLLNTVYLQRIAASLEEIAKKSNIEIFNLMQQKEYWMIRYRRKLREIDRLEAEIKELEKIKSPSNVTEPSTGHGS